MTCETFLRIDQIGEDAIRKTSLWWTIAAIFGFAGGWGSIFIGFILTLIMWLLNGDGTYAFLQSVSNDLFYAAFPLLFFGAYSLDKIDESFKKQSRKKKYAFHK